MVDFKRLSSSLIESLPIDPADIFDQLPKPPNIDDLHKSQAEALHDWFANRDKRDIVIKLNTGGGKTLVGLLIALSSARELHRGSLYLVNSRQLAQQAYEQAQSLDIPASVYSDKYSVSSDFRNGKTILIATYQALFNGKSAFGLDSSAEPVDVAAVIVDDAHSSFGALQDAFSTTINASDEPRLFKQIVSLFREAFAHIDKETTFDELTNGTGSIGIDVLEVPFWSWLDNRRSVARLISDRLSSPSTYDDSDTLTSLRLNWPLIKNDLKYCQAIISRNELTITPFFPLINKFPTFDKAMRRIFMSATFADEGQLIRTFGCLGSDLYNIAPPTLAGVGRRMILQLDEEMDLFSALTDKMRVIAQNNTGVVVLVPSFQSAEWWREHGCNVIPGDSVATTIDSLKADNLTEPVVFVNRYNGLDLPGNACRLLVISGIPQGMSAHQKLYSNRMMASQVYARLIAQNIEQAIGRGTRGSGDHCVVVLFGKDLCDWVRDERHKAYLSPSTRAQIDCCDRIMSDIHSADDFVETIEQGISDDPDFASYLSKGVAKLISERHEETIDAGLKNFAAVERKAFAAWQHGKEGHCVNMLVAYASKDEADKSLRGLALQMAAQAEYSENNAAEAQRLQERAYSLNTHLQKAVFSPEIDEVSDQVKAVVSLVEQLEDAGKSAIDEFDSKTADLAGGRGAHAFEASVEELGKYLGALSRRADKGGEGPDVLWLFKQDNVGVILEAKSEKKEDSSFSKREHGQLLVAREWFRSEYPRTECIAVSIHPNSVADTNASAEETLVITLDKIRELRSTVRALLMSLASSRRNTEARLALCDSYINENHLRGADCIRHRATRFSPKA